MWYSERNGGVDLLVRVVPNASRNEIVGIHDGRLKVKICKPPEDGKVNKELVRFFSKTFGVSKSAVEITAGEKVRSKIVRMNGLHRADLQRAMPFFLDI
ncbi:MAG: DUF167 domain-containing protein [Candidatus Kerfeldbacteria bacterium]